MIKLLEVLEEFVLIFTELSLLFISISILVSFISLRYKNALEKHLGKASFYSYIKAFILGCLTPFCSCSSVPVVNAFLKIKIPLSVCFAFLLSSPLVNPVIITMLILTFGLKFCIFYIVFLSPMILLISFLLSFIDEKKLLKESFIASCHANFTQDKGSNPTFKTQNIFLKNTSNVPLSKFKIKQENPKISLKTLCLQSFKEYKKLFVYLFAAAFIGAFLHGFVPRDFLEGLKDYEILGIFITAFVAIFLYVRVEVIIPLALTLMEFGVPQGIIISLIIAGAGCCLPSLILLKAIFKLQTIALFILIVLTIAISSGLLISI